MNRYYCPGTLGRALLALLLAPAIALAQHPHEGIYFGTFQGPIDDGEFALIVNDRGEGTLAAYDATDDQGFVEQNFHIEADGSFHFVTLRGVHVNGQATDSGISGDYFGADTTGNFSGWRTASEGIFQDAAGFYSGPASVSGTGPDVNTVINSRLVAIIAADGGVFLLLDRAYPGPMDMGLDLALDLNLDLDLDLDLDLGLGFGRDFGRDFVYGRGPDFGPGFPFEVPGGAPLVPVHGLDLPLPFGPWAGARRFPGAIFDDTFPFGPGSDLSVRVGPGFEHGWPFHPNFAFCEPYRWGHGFGGLFGFDFDYTIRLPFLGSIDLDFDFSLPVCRDFPARYRLNPPMANSGGFGEVDADGYLQATLRDGVTIEGYLDAANASAQGVLHQRQDAVWWSGHWEIERHHISGARQLVQQFRRLPDINADGFDDILWRHAVTGEHAVWLMNGVEIMAELPFQFHGASRWDRLWSLAAVTALGDDRQPDFIWRHAATGEVFTWLSDGRLPAEFDLDPAWQLVGSADFDGDSQPEMLVSHSVTGAVALVGDLSGQGSLSPFPRVADPDWVPAAVADFDGDADPDVLWIDPHANGLLIQLMEGAVVFEERFLATETPGDYALINMGDFDGDGVTDLLWFDSVAGTAALTLRPGAVPTVQVQLQHQVAPDWQLAAIGDMDGDGTDDLVWRHRTGGEITIWRLAGAQVADVIPMVPTADPLWKIWP